MVGAETKKSLGPVGRRVFKRGEKLEMVSTEKHYSVPEVAKMWKLSDEKIRELFRDEPGVLKLDCPETLRKRGYCTLRIPQSVLDRVHQRLHGKAA